MAIYQHHEHEAHPLLRAAGELGSLLDEMADASLIGLDPAQTGALLTHLHHLADQLSAVRAGVVVHADQVGLAATTGAKSTAHWLAAHTRIDLRTAIGDHALAQSLARYPRLAAALRAGRVNSAQARAISRSLDNLPADVPSPLLLDAEQALILQAGEHGPKNLAVLGRRILELVAPDVWDDLEAAALAREENAAWEGVKATLYDDGHGTTRLQAYLPTVTADALRTALLAYVTAGKLVDRPAGPHAIGQALVQLIEGLDPGRLPAANGVHAMIAVTMTLESLTTGLGIATLSTGTSMTAHQARRMACEAGVIPVVLGGRSQILDLGRRRRLFTGHQRLALAVRDRGCTAEDCEQPPPLCHAHHDDPWSAGGATDLANARLLCAHHHRRIHDPTYGHEVLGNNQIRFTRRRE